MANAAMSTKDRKDVIDGLVRQGGVIRDAKHTTQVRFPNGESVGITKTTSDYKSRLAMRAAVKRAGYNWPLDDNERRTKGVGKHNEEASLEAVGRTAETVEALLAEGKQPTLPDIKHWLRAHGKPVGADETIKNALRALGWEERRGRRLGRGWSWEWYRVDEIEEQAADLEAVAADMREYGDDEALKEMVATTVDQPQPEPKPEPSALEHPLPAKLSEDAEWALSEAQRLEERAVKAEAEVERLTGEIGVERRENQSRVDQLQEMINELRASGSRWRQLAETTDAEVERLLVENRELTDRNARQAVAITQLHEQVDKARQDTGDTQSWPAEVSKGMTIGDFITGAEQFGLVPVIRLRRK